MPEAARVVTTDAEIDLAIKNAKAYEKYDRKAVRADFSKSADRLRLILDDGVICTIPRHLIQGLSSAQKKDLKPIQILGGGTGLLWPILDVAHSVQGLLSGVYGSARWMAQLKSDSKSNSSTQRGQLVGIDSRHHDLNGMIGEKSGNTLVGTLRKVYGEDFLSDWRSDAKLSAVRQELDMSLNEMVRQYKLGKILRPPLTQSSQTETLLRDNREASMANGLDGRHRDKDGRISEKHGNTEVGTLREEYGQDFLADWRSDAHLETVREATGKSLRELVREYQNR